MGRYSVTKKQFDEVSKVFEEVLKKERTIIYNSEKEILKLILVY